MRVEFGEMKYDNEVLTRTIMYDDEYITIQSSLEFTMTFVGNYFVNNKRFEIKLDDSTNFGTSCDVISINFHRNFNNSS